MIAASKSSIIDKLWKILINKLLDLCDSRLQTGLGSARDV
jgi:hypothetical protein